jgi:hypothetical protein
MTTELTAVSTYGWYTDDEHELDLLSSVSTFGWYGVTLADLVEFFQTVDFGLIIDQIHDLGLVLEVQHELGNLEITQAKQLGNFEITQNFNLRLRR